MSYDQSLKAALGQLEHEAVRWAAGGDAAPLVDAAALALAAGLDTPSLRMLAGAPLAAANDEALDLAPRVFSELGLDIHARLSTAAVEAYRGAPPSRSQVREWIDKLAAGAITRDSASALAEPWIVDREHEVEDQVVQRGLDLLVGADTPAPDRPYLFGPEDFRSWLREHDQLVAGMR